MKKGKILFKELLEMVVCMIWGFSVTAVFLNIGEAYGWHLTLRVAMAVVVCLAGVGIFTILKERGDRK